MEAGYFLFTVNLIGQKYSVLIDVTNKNPLESTLMMCKVLYARRPYFAVQEVLARFSATRSICFKDQFRRTNLTSV